MADEALTLKDIFGKEYPGQVLLELGTADNPEAMISVLLDMVNEVFDKTGGAKQYAQFSLDQLFMFGVYMVNMAVIQMPQLTPQHIFTLMNNLGGVCRACCGATLNGLYGSGRVDTERGKQKGLVFAPPRSTMIERHPISPEMIKQVEEQTGTKIEPGDENVDFHFRTEAVDVYPALSNETGDDEGGRNSKENEKEKK